MNNKTNKIGIIIVMLLVLVGGYLVYTNESKDTASALFNDKGGVQVPSTSGGGGSAATDKASLWTIKFYDKDGNELDTGDMFIAKKVNNLFMAVRPNTAIACTEDTEIASPTGCPGAAVHCYNNQCVITGPVAMSLGFDVRNTASEIPYTFVQVDKAATTPAIFSNALDSRIVPSLVAGGSTQFTTLTPIDITTLTGTVTFNAIVKGTNTYTQTVTQSSAGSLILNFGADPTGGLTVTMINPFG